ncbi:hypothetical protein K431DRAFT_281731 [Polychaeton citri CBS 116435]|uniref:DRBM domain-containing protein n=1 Tax=Polychaeton citri CBS 116435 TaxID=1314669 RepID=A0A9P4QFA7_9PEZI|nr:hypothetical protein K431DRAFT_281731 [Polychaeton citri CBS 116435]
MYSPLGWNPICNASFTGIYLTWALGYISLRFVIELGRCWALNRFSPLPPLPFPPTNPSRCFCDYVPLPLLATISRFSALVILLRRLTVTAVQRQGETVGIERTRNGFAASVHRRRISRKTALTLEGFDTLAIATGASMFYSMYLSSLCQRRHWPEPLYEPYRNRHGYLCKVRVNNREYVTDVPYETEALAKDGAATKAYMICRNFSANDGMLPGQRPGQLSASGVVQGLPVAIGTGRRSNRSSASSSSDAQISDGTASGSEPDSPKSLDGTFESQLQQITHQTMPKARRPHRLNEYMCYCRRAPVSAYGRCGYCIRESGWA